MLATPVQRRQPCPPAYMQIVQQVIRAVSRGELRPGARMPPIRSTAAAAQVHVNTAQRALRTLVVLEVLEVHRGRGIFVREPLPERGASESLRDAAAALVRSARSAGVGFPALLDLVSEHWIVQQAEP
jgi:GntR family transcriptional regulator